MTRDATATMRKHSVLESHANVDHIFLLGRDNISKPLSSKEIHFKQANNHHRLETLKASCYRHPEAFQSYKRC